MVDVTTRCAGCEAIEVGLQPSAIPHSLEDGACRLAGLPIDGTWEHVGTVIRERVTHRYVGEIRTLPGDTPERVRTNLALMAAAPEMRRQLMVLAAFCAGLDPMDLEAARALLRRTR